MPVRHPPGRHQVQAWPQVRQRGTGRALGRLGIGQGEAVRDVARQAQCELEACKRTRRPARRFCTRLIESTGI
eukprot:2113975-Alexandrium_andersonii.AAC.1